MDFSSFFLSITFLQPHFYGYLDGVALKLVLQKKNYEDSEQVHVFSFCLNSYLCSAFVFFSIFLLAHRLQMI